MERKTVRRRPYKNYVGTEIRQAYRPAARADNGRDRTLSDRFRSAHRCNSLSVRCRWSQDKIQLLPRWHPRSQIMPLSAGCRRHCR
jgi:hypothetical protein